MREIDSEYIANQISSLTRIPIRVYIDNELVNYSDPTHFPKDPAAPFLDSFMAIGQAVSYYITPYEQFYGIISYVVEHIGKQSHEYIGTWKPAYVFYKLSYEDDNHIPR